MTYFYDSGDATTHGFLDMEVKNDDVGLLKAAGLSGEEEIQILTVVGAKAEDVWAPLIMNGTEAKLSATNTQLLLDAPGWYRLDVTGAGSFAARVRVTFDSLEREKLANTPHPFLLGPEALAEALAEALSQGQVEISDVTLGYVIDADAPTGVVVLSKQIDEDTGDETQRRVAYMYDGSVVDPYTGPFGPLPAEPTTFAVSHTEIGCSNGEPWTRRTTLVRDESNNIVATLVSYIDSSGAAQAAAPPDFRIGPCPVLCEPSTPVGVIATWG